MEAMMEVSTYSFCGEAMGGEWPCWFPFLSAAHIEGGVPNYGRPSGGGELLVPDGPAPRAHRDLWVRSAVHQFTHIKFITTKNKGN